MENLNIYSKTPDGSLQHVQVDLSYLFNKEKMWNISLD